MQVVPPVESEPDLAESSDPPKRRPWFDRQGIIQAHAGFVVALIALLSSYDHISLPAGINLQLQQQWGVWFILASMALVLADAQLASQSRHREADQRLSAANEAARERIKADRERKRSALRAQQQARSHFGFCEAVAIVFSSATNSTPTQ